MISSTRKYFVAPGVKLKRDGVGCTYITQRVTAVTVPATITSFFKSSASDDLLDDQSLTNKMSTVKRVVVLAWNCDRMKSYQIQGLQVN